MSEVKNVEIQDIISVVKQKKRWADTKLILKAYQYAKEHHGDQCRKSGEPYIIHPIQVAYTLAEIGLDEATICAALLHDVVEDTDVTNEDLIREFGKEIAEMVAGVTKLGKLQFTTSEEQQVEDYRKMFLAMGKDIRVILIKLADRLHNMRTLKFLSRDRQIANARETMDLYAPLANRLGVYSLKWELEDLSFKYLYPEEFHELVAGLDKKREERLQFIEKIMADIRVELKKQKIDAEVTGRAKHLYSIYRKMKRDNKTLDQIYDLFALRILVNSVKDCYAALGVVHEMYNPMPGRFKDYISVPKPNMYQSIHTTLLGEKGTPFEVQIRTWDMHRIAEYGIAAHWAYKDASYSKKGKQNVIVTEDKLSWLRETLEWQKDMQDPQEFLNTLKTELFEDEVYVFTPKGKILVLPMGATPIDFAYSIHEEIGNHMVGCKINSKMMPIITKIQSGDIIEILTSDTQKGPSRDWLKFIKTTKAKSKIQAWFKREQREENIDRGKELIEKEVKRIGMSYTELFKQEYVNVALERYKFKNLEDMYASVGFGAISPVKIIARMLQEYRKDHNEENIEAKIEELANQKKRPANAQNNGVIVKGIDNCLVKLSKCCHPVPGDNIIGYITKGRGVSIHRTDCSNIKELIQEEDRLIDVAWASQEKASYFVDIEIFANDRNGLLADIVKEINNTKINLQAVSSRITKEKIAVTEVKIEVENIEELNKVLKALRKIDSVYEVKRKR
ncbi:MAG TPA: bifunctional (p)ppGpp synthetase/guanosine-3',5'-bis(diphosphate) 3'-pyrophosphohydrolase [Candidatus Merdicola faecigallinarum]|uniref:GTP diphosphokinase n=1 Tax=Candidatus Merdicola faecigallinarum TaxID=2840862 RepID=A0A9D1M247_9FIRM|nr:bifunctional (p)ppGpp synthetase/guanosine-3',5'-bis(diphosphate) 3'-pyrophosphohydrolase [Candidatus Merdicola faecigallinarum]